MEGLNGDPLPLVLRLMDHQLVGPDDQLLGNVDDLQLQELDGDLVVTGLLSGPAALAGRQGGRLGGWVTAIWRRLHPTDDPQPAVVPLEEVQRLDSAVHVSAAATRVLEQNAGLERWLRTYLVSRLPGALGGDEDGSHDGHEPGEGADRPGPAAGARRLSDLLGAPVEDQHGGHVGTVIEVVAGTRQRDRSRLGPLTVEALVTSRRRLGQELGYTMSPMGPWLLRVLMRAWHRDDRVVAAGDLGPIAWDEDQVRVALRTDAELRHPHEVHR